MRGKPTFEELQRLIQERKPKSYEALESLLASVGWTIPEYDAVPEPPVRRSPEAKARRVEGTRFTRRMKARSG